MLNISKLKNVTPLLPVTLVLLFRLAKALSKCNHYALQSTIKLKQKKSKYFFQTVFPFPTALLATDLGLIRIYKKSEQRAWLYNPSTHKSVFFIIEKGLVFDLRLKVRFFYSYTGNLKERYWDQYILGHFTGFLIPSIQFLQPIIQFLQTSNIDDITCR